MIVGNAILVVYYVRDGWRNLAPAYILLPG